VGWLIGFLGAYSPLRQLGIRKATDLLKAFPAKRLGLDPGKELVPGSAWQEYLAEVSGQGLDQAQLRTIVRVLDEEPSLAPVWNWQQRGVHKYVPPEREVLVIAPQPASRAAGFPPPPAAKRHVSRLVTCH